MIHACNSSTRRLKQENPEFKVSMSYIVSSRPTQTTITKNKKEKRTGHFLKG
jgi:hypothetical protein